MPAINCATHIEHAIYDHHVQFAHIRTIDLVIGVVGRSIIIYMLSHKRI